MPLHIDLRGYRAVVTGVTSGIGAGIAAALAGAGCDVAGCGVEQDDSAGARGFRDNVQQHGARAFYRSIDLTEPSSARQFVEWAAKQLESVDIVVSNAGRNVFKGVDSCSEDDWNANMALNLAAHWRLAQAAKPYFDRARQPVMIIVTSNHAHYTMPGSFPYNVAKAGLKALVQSLAIEWGPHVRAVGIAPGFIDTPLAAAWFDSFPDPVAKRAQIEQLHPVGRVGLPADVAALCTFLCSPLASFISGTTVLIDGGRSAVMQGG